MEELNIYQRMHAIMGDVTYITKEEKLVNNQYRFVSHDAVAGKIHEALVQHRVVAVPLYENVETDGNRNVCNLSLQFVNIDKPDESIFVTTYGFGIDKQDKGPGKAMSYAYKFALLKAFCLETGEDPERDMIDYSSEEKTEQKSTYKSRWPTLAERNRVYTAIRDQIDECDTVEALEATISQDYKREINAFRKEIPEYYDALIESAGKRKEQIMNGETI